MPMQSQRIAPLARAADYAVGFRDRAHPLHPAETASELRARFCVALPDGPRDGMAVVDDLIAAAEPGLVGNTDGNFFAWVMGGSSPVGVAADWLTSVWGQNGAIYQTSPAAAIAEEAVSEWLLDMLDLPRDASVGFVTGATMAAFVGLAAARSAVLARAGHDFETLGLQNAPQIRVFLSDDAHVTNLTAIRHIGLGDANCVLVPSDDQGRMVLADLAAAMAAHVGPKIVIAQAGHINSGAFEDFTQIAALAKRHDAWLHVDGAFGLWAAIAPKKAHLVKDADLADSWSVDGHKWMQIPYDSGFAIVRDRDAHRRAMDISASYLNAADEDGRNPTHFNPELSRRARGFAAWAVFQSMGRLGARSLVEQHCRCAEAIASRIAKIPGLRVVNQVALNQVVVGCENDDDFESMCALSDRLNACGAFFVRPTHWKGVHVLRISVVNPLTTEREIDRLADAIDACWLSISNERDPPALSRGR